MRDFGKDREICNSAWPGPWKITPERRLMMGLPQEVCDFIEAAREGWPAAMDRIAELEAENARLKEESDKGCPHCACTFCERRHRSK